MGRHDDIVAAGVREVVIVFHSSKFDDEPSHRPLERALLEALPELAGLDASPGVVARRR